MKTLQSIALTAVLATSFAVAHDVTEVVNTVAQTATSTTEAVVNEATNLVKAAAVATKEAAEEVHACCDHN